MNYDAKKYICAPWHGKRGPPWSRNFKPEFENALKLQKDNFSSVFQTLTGTDFGGWTANAPAHINGAGALAGQNAQSIHSRTTRKDTFLSLIQTHILNEDITDGITDYIANTLTGAPPQPLPLGPGGAAVAGELPDDWITQLWAWIDIQYGQLQNTGLLHSNQTTDWVNAKLSDVGIDRDTPRRFYGHLLRLNRQRQIPHPILEIWTKYLRQFTFPRVLADSALQQMQSPTFVLAGGPNAGQPNLSALVDNFEEIWHTIYDRGIEIKPQAAPKPPAGPSNRVDGMSLTVQDEHSDYQSYDWQGVTSAELHEAYIVTAGTDAFAFLKDERNCWICRGWGHTKEKCPSAKRSRPLSACITGLQQIQSTQNERLRSMQGRRLTKRPGPSPGNRGKSNFTPSTQSTSFAASQIEIFQYEDGGVYTADGEELVAPTMTPEISTAESSVAKVVPTAPAPSTDATATVPTVQSSVAIVSANAQPHDSANAQLNESANATFNPLEDLDRRIAQDFTSSFSANSAEVISDEIPSPVDQYTRTESRTSRVITSVACATLFAISACALGARSTRGRALLTMLAFAAPTHSVAMPPTTIHSSKFARANSYMMAANGSPPPRDHGVMDSGSTECASGRRKLFPDHLIEQHNPPIRVEIASGFTLPVAFRGGMQMKVRKFGTTSAKKTFPLTCSHSLYVPRMPVTLVSTKALFRYHGIRTYFNDDLVVVLPTGERIGFVETSNNYTVLFADDSSEVNITGVPRQPDAHFVTTLREPVPLTWDICHGRYCHFSPSRIQASVRFLHNSGIDKLGNFPRSHEICKACVQGAFRGHRHGKRPAGQFTYFGQRVYSDSCAMPKSTPFCFTYMYIFYDAYSKFIAVYFGKSTTGEEMMKVFQQFLTDYGRYMKNNKVDQWYTDGGPEFSSTDTAVFCNEMATRHRFIAPWNPWMNVAETGWRIILRPLRTVLAAANVSRRLWPFAVSQIVRVHNALSSASESAETTEGNLVQTFIASLIDHKKLPSPSPYFLVTGKCFDASLLRTMFCEIEVRIRSAPDLKQREKVDPITDPGIYLGIDSRCVGALVYLTSSRATIIFREL